MTNGIPTDGLKLASVVGQYSQTGALILVGWVLYQTIGVELPATRAQTFTIYKAMTESMTQLATRLESNGAILSHNAKLLEDGNKLHMEQGRLLIEMSKQISDLKRKPGDN